MTIERYLDMLCGRLSVDPLRRDEIRLEVHTHLRQRADDLQSRGLDRETAEAWAAEEFGDPLDVASRLSVSQPAWVAPQVRSHADCAGLLLIFFGLSEYVTCLGLGMLAGGGVNVGLASVCEGLRVFLGWSLVRHRRWARFPAMGLALVWLALYGWTIVPMLIPSLFPHSTVARFTLRDVQTLALSVAPVLANLYVVWALMGRRARRLAWR